MSSNLSDVLRDLAEGENKPRGDESSAADHAAADAPQDAQTPAHGEDADAAGTAGTAGADESADEPDRRAPAPSEAELESSQPPPPATPTAAASAQPADPASAPSNAPADDEPIVGEIDDESGDAIAASPRREPAPSAAGRGRSRPSQKQRADLQFKSFAVPVLITVGGLLMLIGIWGTAVSQGADIWLSDRPRAGQVATAAQLAGYPLGIALFAGAGFFIFQLQQSKKGGASGSASSASSARRRR